MKIGLQIPDLTTPGGPARLRADLATVARTADDASFDFIAVMEDQRILTASWPSPGG